LNTENHENSTLWNKGFIVIILVSCLVNFGNFFVGSAFSYWIVDIGGSSATFGLIHGLYSALCLVARPITGWLADNGNRRTTFILSCFVYVSSMILMLISPFFGLFVALRLIQGLGIGSASTLVTTCSYDEIPTKHLDKGVGYIALISSLATAATPALAIKSYNQSGPQSLVLWSTISIILGVGLSFFVVFRKPAVQKKLKLKDVFDPKQLFDVRCLKAAIPLAFSLNLSMGVGTFVTLFGRSLGFANPGWFSTISAIGLLCVRLILDRIKSDTAYPRKRIYFSFCVFILYILCIGLCRNMVMFCIAAILKAVTLGTMMPCFTSMIIQSVPPERRGVAASTTGICGDVGMILGSTIGGFVSNLWGYPVMFLLLIIPVVACCIYYRFALDGRYVPWSQQQAISAAQAVALPGSGTESLPEANIANK
jgi:MFS family permease